MPIICFFNGAVARISERGGDRSDPAAGRFGSVAGAAVRRRIAAGLAEREAQKGLHPGNGGRNSPTPGRPVPKGTVANLAKTATISQR